MTSSDRSDILGKSRHVQRAAVALAVTATLAAAPQAHAEDWGGLNADRSITYFSSDFGLAPGDTNFSSDLYANDDGTITLVSGGDRSGKSTFAFASESGSIVYFTTDQPLAADDSGTSEDVYVRTSAGLQRITPPSAAGSLVSVMGITPDGSRAWLRTSAAMVPDDDDTTVDIYEYRPATKDLVLLTHSTAQNTVFDVGSVDGTTVWLRTEEGLDPTDTDGTVDIYRLKNGLYVRLTPGNTPHHVHLHKVGRTSETLIFSTNESLVAADIDGKLDIYRRSGLGPVELVTASGAGAASKSVGFEGADTEGGRIIFRTSEPLLAGDNDATSDVYAAENGTMLLLSSGPDDGSYPIVEAVTDDAQTVLLGTTSKLLPSDTDGSYDLYRYSAGNKVLTHVNPTNNTFTPSYSLMAPTSALVAWETEEPLVADDDDTAQDIYVYSPALGIQFASGRAERSPAGGPAGDDLEMHDVLPNGHVLFSTSERLMPTDKDDAKDLYKFGGLQLTHVSRDTSPPETIATAPASVTEGQTISVDVASTEHGTLECRVDTSTWSDCLSGALVVRPLPVGAHTVQARATDVAGNVDSTPASVTVVVLPAAGAADVPVVPGAGPTSAVPAAAPDTVAPQLTDTRLRLRRGAPTLSVTVSEAASLAVRLQRRVDGRWRTVRSLTKGVAAGPRRLELARRVGSGKHRAVVVATDPTGNATAPLKLALRR